VTASQDRGSLAAGVMSSMRWARRSDCCGKASISAKDRIYRALQYPPGTGLAVVPPNADRDGRFQFARSSSSGCGSIWSDRTGGRVLGVLGVGLHDGCGATHPTPSA
jgi:hypothetical protein